MSSRVKCSLEAKNSSMMSLRGSVKWRPRRRMQSSILARNSASVAWRPFLGRPVSGEAMGRLYHRTREGVDRAFRLGPISIARASRGKDADDVVVIVDGFGHQKGCCLVHQHHERF